MLHKVLKMYFQSFRIFHPCQRAVMRRAQSSVGCLPLFDHQYTICCLMTLWLPQVENRAHHGVPWRHFGESQPDFSLKADALCDLAKD